MIKLLFVPTCIEKMKDCLILPIWTRLNKESMLNTKKTDKTNNKFEQRYSVLVVTNKAEYENIK